MVALFDMTTRFIFLLILTASTSLGGNGQAEVPRNLPEVVAEQLVAIRGRLAGPYNGLRLQVYQLPQGVYVDPPPDWKNFKSEAGMGIFLRADNFAGGIKDLVDAAEGCTWRRRESAGYPRWLLQFVGPWDEIVAEWLIDREGFSICIHDEWYRVDKDLVDRATIGLVQKVAESALTEGNATVPL